jgi:hypothetical protein
MGDVDTPMILVLIYTDENLFCKDDETHVSIETKKSISIMFIINELSKEFFAIRFILSINGGRAKV